jgi:hypothetical protein
MQLEILRAILHKHNYTVVRLLYNYFHFTTAELQAKSGLSRKQIYESLFRLKAVDAIKKENKEYRLTDIAIDILKYVNVIEEIEQNKLNYKLREIITKDKKLPEEDKQKIFKDLKLKMVIWVAAFSVSLDSVMEQLFFYYLPFL